MTRNDRFVHSDLFSIKSNEIHLLDVYSNPFPNKSFFFRKSSWIKRICFKSFSSYIRSHSIRTLNRCHYLARRLSSSIDFTHRCFFQKRWHFISIYKGLFEQWFLLGWVWLVLGLGFKPRDASRRSSSILPTERIRPSSAFFLFFIKSISLHYLSFNIT